MDKLFKQFYYPRVVKQYYNATPIMTRIKKMSEDLEFAGKQVVIPVKKGWSEGVGARAEGDDLPNPYYAPVDQMLVDVAYIYGVWKITRPSIKASRSPGAWERLMTFTMDDVKENLIWDGARQRVHGTGTGSITQINGTATSATQTVDDTTLLREGMVIDVYTAESGGSQDVNSIRITAINSATSITLASSQTCNDNSYVFREDSRGNEMMGLAGIVDDGTYVGVFQGLNRATAGNSWLKSGVMGNSGTDRPLTISLLNQAAARAEQSGAGGWPTAIYSNYALGLKYVDLLTADRRYVGTKKFDGGFEGIEHTTPGGTIPWFFDRMIRPKKIYLVHEPDLLQVQLTPLEVVDDIDGRVMRQVTNKDEYTGYMAEYGTLAATRCNRHTRIDDLIDT
jgi:hypothetical protein